MVDLLLHHFFLLACKRNNTITSLFHSFTVAHSKNSFFQKATVLFFSFLLESSSIKYANKWTTSLRRDSTIFWYFLIVYKHQHRARVRESCSVCLSDIIAPSGTSLSLSLSPTHLFLPASINTRNSPWLILTLISFFSWVECWLLD